MLNTSILLIEDQHEVLNMYVEILSKIKNTTIASFENPLDGIEYAIRDKPDIVITDNMMPYVDGFYVAQKIREVYSPKIILASAISSRILPKQNTTCFDKHFKKPFDPLSLISELETIIEEINKKKIAILNRTTSGFLEGINIVGKDRLFIENVVKTIMYDTDKPAEDSVYAILVQELNKDESTIRRNINKVVEKTYEPTLFEKIMGLNKKPKNVEFINTLIKKINENAKKEKW